MSELAVQESYFNEDRFHPPNSINSQKWDTSSKFMDIIGQSRPMKRVFGLIERVADSDSTIMIQGETGTGKGMVAKAIHRNSYRKNKPFVQINCGAIPENLLESELFGHVRGAFTGATAPKTGKFEQANGGTVFLDEIGDMSHDLQVKVLRAIEEKEFEQVGGCKTIKVDVRILAATHRDLEKEVQKGNFREDLFYRLNVIPVRLPSLKERKSDLPLLVHYFLDEFNRTKNTAISNVSDDAMDILIKHLWPGNVRELKNMMERLVVLKGKGQIQVCDIPYNLRNIKEDATGPQMDLTDDGICLNTAVNDFEKQLIYKSLEKTNWVKNQAAKLLHLKRTTLVEKIKRYKLQRN